MKISRKQAEEFGLLTAKKFFGLEIANYYLEKMDNNDFEIMYSVMMKIPLYLILFIPVHVFCFLACVWDGGIKEFEICDNEIARELVNFGNPHYEDIVKLIDSNNQGK